MGLVKITLDVSMKEQKGILTISLDFELMWGMLDSSLAKEYKDSHVKQVPEVIDKLLKTFTKHNVHATFATVGFICYSNPEELKNDLPSLKPNYRNTSLNPYHNNFIESIPEEEYQYYFVPHLIDNIKSTPGMEIGTHTFSHYYCWEEGQTTEHFDADLKKALQKGKEEGIEIKSIIFPRNNVSSAYLDICKKNGVKIYRGNPSKFFKNKNRRISNLIQKACRLADNYINVSGSLSYPLLEIKDENGMIDIRASRMLRPYLRSLRHFEPLRLRRIKKEMTRAAKRGEVYHLWWHPHNFGANMNENFSFLEKILLHFEYLENRYGMKALNMKEISKLIN